MSVGAQHEVLGDGFGWKLRKLVAVGTFVVALAVLDAMV